MQESGGTAVSEPEAGEIVDADYTVEEVRIEGEIVAGDEPEADEPVVVEATEKPDLDAYDRETVSLVEAAAREADEAEARHLAAKERAAMLKKDFEAMSDRLLALIRARKENRGKPVQKTLVSDLPEPDGAEGETEGETPKAEDEAWRQVPLSEWVNFGATEKDIELLAQHVPAIVTVGDLADFTRPPAGNPDGGKRLSDIKGYGKARIDRVSEAEPKFWASRKETVGE